MCIICVHYEKEKMSILEATRALGEMRTTLDPEHVEEIEEKLFKDALTQQQEEPEEDFWYYINSDYFGSD